MARTGSQPTFEAAVLVTDGKDTRIAVRIQIQGNEVYAFRPQKGGPVKISFHASGQRHVQIGKGAHQLIRHETPRDLLSTEDGLLTTSLDNFTSLMPYKGEAFNAVETIDLRTFPANSLPLVEVAVGNSFAGAANVQEPRLCGDGRQRNGRTRHATRHLHPSEVPVCCSRITFARGSG
jgi:hypothetical protein